MTENEELLMLTLFTDLCCSNDEDPDLSEEAIEALALVKMEIMLKEVSRERDVCREEFSRATRNMRRYHIQYCELLNAMMKEMEESNDRA